MVGHLGCAAKFWDHQKSEIPKNEIAPTCRIPFPCVNANLSQLLLCSEAPAAHSTKMAHIRRLWPSLGRDQQLDRAYITLDQYFLVRSSLKSSFNVPPEARMRENVGITHLNLVPCLTPIFWKIRTLSRRTSKSCSCSRAHNCAVSGLSCALKQTLRRARRRAPSGVRTTCFKEWHLG